MGVSNHASEQCSGSRHRVETCQFRISHPYIPVARFRVRKEEDKVGVSRLYSIAQNHKTKVAELAHFTKAQLFLITQFPGILYFSYVLNMLNIYNQKS